MNYCISWSQLVTNAVCKAMWRHGRNEKHPLLSTLLHFEPAVALRWSSRIAPCRTHHNCEETRIWMIFLRSLQSLFKVSSRSLQAVPASPEDPPPNYLPALLIPFFECTLVPSSKLFAVKIPVGNIYSYQNSQTNYFFIRSVSKWFLLNATHQKYNIAIPLFP